MTQAKGRFVWHELHTTDREKATKFYAQLMGWEIKDVEMGPGEKYGLVLRGGKDFAGITKSKAPPQVPSHWLSYIAVEDVDASTKQAKELGATVRMEPMNIPSVGRFAVVSDPQGATFALFKGEKDYGEEPAIPAEGTFCWREVMSNDPEASAKFYASLFGYTVEAMDMGPMGTYRLLKRGDKQTGGVMKLPPGVPMSSWLSYLAVKDVDASTRNAKELGAKVQMEPMDIPNIGRFSVLMDPTGAAIALFQGFPPKP